MHVENEWVELVPTGEQEYEEVIEKYEEEVLIQEEAPQPLTDSANTVPAQDKPQCIALILNNHWIYIYMCVHLCYTYFMETTCIDIPTYEFY